MQNFTLLFSVVGTIVLIAMITPYFNWWVKSLIVIYYGSLSFVFIYKYTIINEKYKDIAPVPTAYWEENSQWVWIASNLIFWPFGVILLYLLYRGFQRVQTLPAKIFIVIGLLLGALLMLFFKFVFNLEYGYRP